MMALGKSNYGIFIFLVMVFNVFYLIPARLSLLHPAGLFLYHLKTLENLWFSVFQEI